MPEYLVPGVYIEELNTGNKPIEGVSTSTVGFLGIAERGPSKAMLITSYTDFARAFGPSGSSGATPGLSSLAVASGGGGYTDPDGWHTVSLVGGTGTQATVSVKVAGGVVTAVRGVTQGKYSVPPTSPAQISGLTPSAGAGGAGGAAGGGAAAGGAGGGAGAAAGGATISFSVFDGEIYLAYAVEGFFQNGGRRCFVQAVTPSKSESATISYKSNIAFSAVSGGSWGNRVAVKIEKGTISGDKLTVIYWSTSPPTMTDGKTVKVDPTSRDPEKLHSSDRLDPQAIEVFDNLNSSNPSSPNSYANQITGVSNLLQVANQSGSASSDLSNLTLLSGGTDGFLAPIDFEGDPNSLPEERSGLEALKEIDEIALLCCPDAYALGNTAGVNDALINQCENLMNRFAIIASPLQSKQPGTLADNIPITNRSKYAAFYYPAINIIDPQTGLKKLIPSGGHIAGIYARSDITRGIQKDPANEPIRGIDSLLVNVTDGDQAILNPKGVNALRYFKGYGNLVWGGRTTSLDPDWKYINVRRIFIFVEQSILRAMQWAVFEINDEPVWAQIRRSVSDFLTRLWMDDVLQGATKEEAFFVRCDRTTMTQYDIDNGRLICVIGIAPVKPAEFVIFRIGQWAGGSSVSEQ